LVVAWDGSYLRRLAAMASRPDIRPYDWLRVGATRGVVSVVRSPGDSRGDCELVLNRTNPTNRDVRWTGEKWEFGQSRDYADKYGRLRTFVAILKAGFE
jgi:hypothetical protein